MLLNDWRVLPNPSRYAPSMLELWEQFSAHTGYVFVIVAAVAVAVWLLSRATDERRAALAGWVIAGSIAFTLTDWRQTKHLMNQLAPMVAAAVAFAWPAIAARLGRPGGDGRGAKRAAAALLVIAFAVNVATDVRLVADFRSLTVLGASDIDGW